MPWAKVKKLLRNPQKLSKIPELKYWLFIILLLIAVFFTFSSYDFSFLLTLSSVLESLSFIGIILQLQQSTQGLSCNTFTIYSILYFSRLTSILVYESYLPFDSTGDWLYQTVEIFSLLQSLWIVNRLKNVAEGSEVLFTIPFFVIASMLVHPTLNKNFLTDTLWMLSMNLNSIVVLPLLWKVKSYGDLESFSSHFIAAQTVARVLSFLFWVQTFKELNRPYGKYVWLPEYAGYVMILMQIISLATTGHFLWYYVKSAVLGTPFVLPY